MSSLSNSATHPLQTTIYQIGVEGHLGPEWEDWFENLAITLEEDGRTLLTGPVADQAALHGLLKKIRDLGMPLLSVLRMRPEAGAGRAPTQFTSEGEANEPHE